VQAVNGLLLPLLVIFLVFVVNDHGLIRTEERPSIVYNIILLFILGAVLLMGLNSLNSAITSGLGLAVIHPNVVFAVTAIVILYMCWQVFRKKRRERA
jgi:heme A synthase